MISEETYKRYSEDIQRFEHENPLITALNLICPWEINVIELERELQSAGIDICSAVDYYHKKNLLALHKSKNSDGDEREKFAKEVQRTHEIASYLERSLVGYPVDNPC